MRTLSIPSWLPALVLLVGCSPEVVDPTDAGRGDAFTSADAPPGTDVPAIGTDAGSTDAPLLDAPSTGSDAPSDGGSSGGPFFVVVLGSSTAAGKNLDEPMYGGEPDLSNSWVNRYDRYLGAARPGSPTVVNLAVAGYSTFSVLPTGTTIPMAFAPMTGRPDPMRNITHAVSLAPDVILINFPSGGDLNMGYTVDQIVANLVILRDTAAAAGIPVWVSTSSPTADTNATFVAAVRDLNRRTLETFGDHTLDFYTPRANPDGSPIAATSLTDALPHPNAEGHRLLFDVVVTAGIPDRVRP